MSRFVCIGLVVAAAGLLATSAAVASVPDPNYSTVEWEAVEDTTAFGDCILGPAGLGGATLVKCSRPGFCPNGDNGNKLNFQPAAAKIRLTVRDQFGNAMAGIAASDIYVTVCASCDFDPPVIYAAGPTNAGGQTFIFIRRVGGCCPVVPVIVQGINLKDLEYRSFDFNADLAVDLSDLTFLARTYNKGTGCPVPNPTNYNECFDFTCNDCVDLSDLTLFARHYNHTCDYPLLF